MAEDLGENPPVLQPPIECLMPRPHPALHPQIFRRICIICWALDLVRVPAVAVVGLHALAGLKEAGEDFVENNYIGVLTRRVRTLDPHQAPPQNADSKLLSERRLSCVLVGHKGVPLLWQSLLRHTEVGAIDGHEAVVAHVTFKAPGEVNLEEGTVERGGA
jgi:hypothetical protein